MRSHETVVSARARVGVTSVHTTLAGTPTHGDPPSTLGKNFFEKNFDVPVGRLMFHCMHGGYVSAGATRLLLR